MVRRFLTLAKADLDEYKADLGPEFIAMHRDAIGTLLADAWKTVNEIWRPRYDQ